MMMYHWLLISVLPILLLTQITRVQAAWATNLAVLQLQVPWLFQQSSVLNPPCTCTGTFQNTRRLLELSDARTSENPRVTTHLGRVLWLEGDCADAIVIWEQAYVSHHDSTAAFELMRVGAYGSLSPDLRLAFADLTYDRARKLNESQEHQAAFEWVSRAFQLAPQERSAKALVNFANTSEDTTSSSALWQDMSNLLPISEAGHWWAIGERDMLEREWEAAALAFAQGATLSPEPADFWMRSGDAWLQARNWTQAALAYEFSQQSCPDSIRPYVGLGNVYRLQGRYQQALNWYNLAKAVSPLSTESYYYLGLTYNAMKENDQAISYLKKVIEMNPNHISAMYALAQTLYGDGHFDLAERWLTDAINRLPEPPASWWMQLGDWRLESHNCIGAREAYIHARDSGGSEQMIQQRVQTYLQVCGSAE